MAAWLGPIVDLKGGNPQGAEELRRDMYLSGVSAEHRPPVMLGGSRGQRPPVMFRIAHRAVGGLTGSHVAGALARVCVEETFHHFKDSWMTYGFQKRAIAGAWVDNIYVISDSPHKAIHILNQAESHLISNWSLHFKPSSKSIMPVRGCEQACTDPGYRVVTRFDALGHVLLSTGSCHVCFDETLKSAWKQFWIHVSPKCRGKLPIKLRLDFMNRFVRPIIRYRCPRWPFSKHKSRLLDIVQRKMLRIVSGIQRKPDETPETFSRRSARLVAVAQHEQGRWSDMWASSVVTWAAHVLRNTNNGSWSFQLLNLQSSTALREIRAFNSNRPGTRAAPGYLPVRWTDGLANAFKHICPLKPGVRSSVETACERHFSVSFSDTHEEHMIASFLSFF